MFATALTNFKIILSYLLFCRIVQLFEAADLSRPNKCRPIAQQMAAAMDGSVQASDRMSSESQEMSL